MSKSDRENVFKWYESNSNDSNYNFQKEMESYCRSDVDILHRCIINFRALFLETIGVDPFDSCITIASACNMVYRKNFLIADTIGIIPTSGYRHNNVQSKKALKWMRYLELSRGVKIRRSGYGGEERIGKFKIDGTYKDKNGQKVLLEYAGCFWHGRSKCFNAEVENPQQNKTMGQLESEFCDKIRELENRGYKLEVIWACEFKKLQTQAHYKQCEQEIQISAVPPLVARDALFGGRTNACKLFAKVIKPGDMILYYDVCSLYPWVMKYCCYPVGHPTVILGNFKNVSEYFGLIKCKVLPPKDLYHPLLPVKVDEKLMFPLCYTCAQNRITKCTHDESKRSFIGTWVTEEVQKAVELGYQILDVFEVWHYDQKSQYDPETKTGGLFSGYISTFQGYKQEANGFPDHIDAKENEYIQNYQEREGVSLRKDKIKYSGGLRSLEKLKLNNLWGKL